MTSYLLLAAPNFCCFFMSNFFILEQKTLIWFIASSSTACPAIPACAPWASAAAALLKVTERGTRPSGRLKLFLFPHRYMGHKMRGYLVHRWYLRAGSLEEIRLELTNKQSDISSDTSLLTICVMWGDYKLSGY